MCQCELDQMATCRIEGNQCASRCRDLKKGLSDEQLTVLVLEDLLRLPPGAFGFDASGRRTNETLSALAFSMLTQMLESDRLGGPRLVQIPPIFLRDAAHPIVSVWLPPAVEPQLRAATSR
jgi:hypothetical protein